MRMRTLESKIKGALYGFAIGDAMGATTEFMSAESIQRQYGEVRDIIGGGWLHLKAGEVTDDTQMMLCVCDAIEKFPKGKTEMLNKCCENFSNWYMTNPPDVGCCCSKVISQCANNHYCLDWMNIAEDPQSLGNGSLMRTLPIILAGHSDDLAILQGRLTHNNELCDTVIVLYCKNIKELLYHDTFRNVPKQLFEPTGHILNTLNNALYWVQSTFTFEQAIIKAVNHGGDADTIAAITGSLAGSLYGYEAIPQRWVDQLDADVKADLDKYAKLFEKINKKVCTNTK